MQLQAEDIFRTDSEESFERVCMKVFRHQYLSSRYYRQYVDLLGISADSVTGIADIPFLPVEFFKQYDIISSVEPDAVPQKIFFSSSTTSQVPSRHCVLDLSIYEQSFMTGFRKFYGPVEDLVILALLPAYLEREGSSLVYMAQRLIEASGSPLSGFYLYDHDRLFNVLGSLQRNATATILLGVSFALLDFVEKYSLRGNNDAWLRVMETGGMKGRRKEVTREELHSELSAGFGVSSIHSEYGMCELLSQAYSSGNGIFRTPSWMRVQTRAIDNPFAPVPASNLGIINIIDLANVNSCAFIETQDVGRVFEDGSFTVEGRLSGAERRGCNMLIE